MHAIDACSKCVCEGPRRTHDQRLRPHQFKPMYRYGWKSTGTGTAKRDDVPVPLLSFSKQVTSTPRTDLQQLNNSTTPNLRHLPTHSTMQQLQAPPTHTTKGHISQAMPLEIDTGNESELTDLSDLEGAGPPIIRSQSAPPAKKTKVVASLKPSKTKRPGKKAKLRTHEISKHLRPDIPAHEFRSVYRRRSMVADYLKGVFETARVIPVDFDMAVAFFLQQVNHLQLGDIPISVNKVLDNFSLLEPLNGRQDSILQCAYHIKQTLNEYATCPSGPKPFALRFPNLTSLNNLAIQRSISPEIVGEGEAVIFIDLAGRVAAVGVPPKEPSHLAKTLSGYKRGRIAFDGAAEVHDLTPFIGPMTFETFTLTSHPPRPNAQSPFQVSEQASILLSGADNRFIEVPGTLNGALPSQAVGYGRYSNLATGMSDTQLRLGANRQGHPLSGWDKADISHYNLPYIIQMGKEHAYKREDHARMDSELLWYLEMGRLIIKAFQPDSYSAAMRALRVIVTKGTPAAAREVKDLVNPVGIGRHTMFGPGYSVHGAFDILMHGVGQITRLPNRGDCPPQRICMAIYSHADVFAGAARFSGMHQNPKVFSDHNLWIPFYPAGFLLSRSLTIFEDEKKRLKEKYRDEVRVYQAAKEAAEEAANKAHEAREAAGALNLAHSYPNHPFSKRSC
ncbi:uncharacterized protein MELLADRAFT_105451 [Melampsora larici-populina 98AG31]|uniref:Uncharacterized protein n=1 Tax=Melampsora larici-populina (strain 98AG31 / pathotype 3-4-7) TaxID=747676 RepID=F4RI63_MELLP|nr:uncharacterized protein MELLADRAFT_105451 [Melampsora larici-populina 98AG31]EGG07947.1 hypothetical protein MELLADRAFT_105451 [Melampsora larici-populina 98AG31]